MGSCGLQSGFFSIASLGIISVHIKPKRRLEDMIFTMALKGGIVLVIGPYNP